MQKSFGAIFTSCVAPAISDLAIELGFEVDSGISRASHAWHPETYEIAPHNLILQSNNLLTTWLIGSMPVTPAKDVTDPYGVANNAWTVTDNDPLAIHFFGQTYTFTANEVCYASVTIKKTTGATSFPLFWTLRDTEIAICTIDTNNKSATLWTQYNGITVLSGSEVTCEDIDADWFTVTLKFTHTVTDATSVVRFAPAATLTADQSTGEYSNTATGSQSVYGFQVNYESKTDYMETTTAVVYGPRLVDTVKGIGILVEKGVTNKLAKADSLAITTSASCTVGGDYKTVSCRTGSLTASGAFTGTVTPSAPLTVTSNTGTLTLTGNATYVQVEAGRDATSWQRGDIVRADEVLIHSTSGWTGYDDGAVSFWLDITPEMRLNYFENTRAIFRFFGSNGIDEIRFIKDRLNGPWTLTSFNHSGGTSEASTGDDYEGLTHFILSWSSANKIQLFVNGDLKDSSSSTTRLPTLMPATFYIGANGGLAYGMGTVMSKFQAYNRHLNEYEAKRLYRSQK